MIPIHILDGGKFLFKVTETISRECNCRPLCPSGYHRSLVHNYLAIYNQKDESYRIIEIPESPDTFEVHFLVPTLKFPKTLW